VSRTRVAIADDDVLLREGLASLLERSGFAVLGTAGNAEQLLDLVRREAPELVIVDIRMPPGLSTEGLDAADVIRREHPETAVLLLSAHVEVEHALQLMAAGQGVGYLLKSRVTDVDEFLESLRRVARGGSVVDPALVRELVDARRRHDPLAALSERERDVLGRVAQLMSTDEIADDLHLSVNTVKTHLKSIYRKLAVSRRGEAVRRARELGLL